MSSTGYTSSSAKFDSTSIENPFYETSSKRDELIEFMKNNPITLSGDFIKNKSTEE